MKEEVGYILGTGMPQQRLNSVKSMSGYRVSQEEEAEG